MVNCGYAVRFYMTRKEYLNLLVKRFPPSPSVNGIYDQFDFHSLLVPIGSCHEKNSEIDQQMEAFPLRQISPQEGFHQCNFDARPAPLQKLHFPARVF